MSLRASQAASLLLLGLLSSSASVPASGCCSRLRLKQLCLLRSGGLRSLTLTAEAVRELDLGLEDTWNREKNKIPLPIQITQNCAGARDLRFG